MDPVTHMHWTMQLAAVINITTIASLKINIITFY